MIIETYGNFYLEDPQSLRQAEQNCFEAVKTRVANESKYQCNLIVNLTWFHTDDLSKREDFLSWVNKHSVPKSTKIYFTAFIDSVTFRYSDYFEEVERLGHDISFEGFGENWYSLFPSWLKKYDNKEILLNPRPRWHYLSYNRKPRTHRTELIKSLIDQNIHTYGWITYERGQFIEIDNSTGSSDDHLHHTPDKIEYLQPFSKPYSRPEDIRTLGVLNIWNDSYCVIVSETCDKDLWQISEKTWKPILGLRPYLLNTNPNVVNILRDLGFYTPGDLFNDKHLDTCEISANVDHLKRLTAKTPSDLYGLWVSQEKMLYHNRELFKELAKKWNFSN